MRNLLDKSSVAQNLNSKAAGAKRHNPVIPILLAKRAILSRMAGAMTMQ